MKVVTVPLRSFGNTMLQPSRVTGSCYWVRLKLCQCPSLLTSDNWFKQIAIKMPKNFVSIHFFKEV